MKLSLLITVAAIAAACGGGSHQADTRDKAVPSKATSSGAATGAMPGADTAASNTAASNEPAASNQLITLIGCLKGPAPAAPTGTSGTRARARATGPETAAADTHSGAGTEGFTLVDAEAASPDSAGVGTSGAGASGGPLVSGKSSFQLDGIPPDAFAHVNATVRVVGRLDANSPVAPSSGGGAATTPASGSRGSNGDAKTASARRLIVERVEVVSDKCGR